MTSQAAVDYVTALPLSTKEEVFTHLLGELMRLKGDEGPIPVAVGGGRIGYFLPPKAVDHLFVTDGPELTPDREAEIQRVIDNPGRTFTLEGLLASLPAEEPAVGPRVGERAIG